MHPPSLLPSPPPYNPTHCPKLRMKLDLVFFLILIAPPDMGAIEKSKKGMSFISSFSDTRSYLILYIAVSLLLGPSKMLGKTAAGRIKPQGSKQH